MRIPCLATILLASSTGWAQQVVESQLSYVSSENSTKVVYMFNGSNRRIDDDDDCIGLTSCTASSGDTYEPIDGGTYTAKALSSPSVIQAGRAMVSTTLTLGVESPNLSTQFAGAEDHSTAEDSLLVNGSGDPAGTQYEIEFELSLIHI